MYTHTNLSLPPLWHIYLVGDNDWNDCSNPSSALKFWQKEFLLFDKRYWKNHTFPVRRQMKREENFSFINKGTLFIGLNIVGGAIINHTEWTRRLEEEFNWCKFLIQFYTNTTVPFPSIGRVVIFGHADPTRNHNSFFVPLRTFIQNELKNRVPILYIHGDRHRWLYEPNYLNQSSMLRISLQGLASEVPLKVSVHATGKSSATNEAFTYERRSYRYTHKKVKRPIKINH